MSQEHIDFTTPGGDTVTAALHKAEDNFNDLYGQIALLNPAGSFKNKLINPNFQYWQRGTSFAPGTNGNFMTADRWKLQVSSGMTSPSATQNPYPNLGDPVAAALGSPYGLLIGGSGNTDAVNHFYILSQAIEDVQRLAGKTVTISITAYNGNAASRRMAVELSQVNGSGTGNVTGIGSTQLTFPSGWSTQRATVAIPAMGGSRVLGSDCTLLTLWFSAGTAYNSRAANLGTQTANLLLGGVQLEEGASATPMEVRPHQVELAMCQRFYYRLTNAARTNIGCGAALNATSFYATFFHPIPMRSAPTVIFNGSWRVLMNGGAATVASLAAAEMSSHQTTIVATSSSMTQGQAGILQGNDGQGANAYVEFNAEL